MPTSSSSVAASCPSVVDVVVAIATRGHSSAGQSIGLRSRSRSVKTSLVARFWSYVDRNRPDACWQWKGGKDDDGYGRFFVAKDSASLKAAKAHHVSLALAGRRIPEGTEIAHGCDNRACVNPLHLEAVSHRENMRQMAARGRTRGGRPGTVRP